MIGRFLAEACVVDDRTHVTAKALRAGYEAWCFDQGERAWSAQALGRELSSRGYDSTEVGRNKTRTWLGVGLLKEAE